MFDDWQSIVALVSAILIAYGVVLWVGLIVWTYRDIRARSRDASWQALGLLLVGLFNLPGLILYLIFRPQETLAEAQERRLEGEALLRGLAEEQHSCPNCQRALKEEFLLCPHCRTKLQEPCSACGHALELGWTACPYCGAQGPSTVTAGPARAAQPAEASPAPPIPSGRSRARRGRPVQAATPPAASRDAKGGSVASDESSQPPPAPEPKPASPSR